MMNKIKWGCIQPLTGGMYIGAYKAIGHHADWILSFDGLDKITVNKEGEITKAANEYNIREWLLKQPLDTDAWKVPYYQITNRKMFDTNFKSTDITLRKGLEENVSAPDYTDMDIVVAVPVCSGLTLATNMPQETSDLRNSNMKWITYYTLNIIKPKVYCFENAPTLFGSRGVAIRAELEHMAETAGYSVLYYKTDTLLHHNCQRRQRTFVIFTKWQNGISQLPPVFGYEKDTLTIPEFFATISADAPQQTPIKSFPWNYATIDYIKHLYGEHWVDIIGTEHNLVMHVVTNKHTDDLLSFVNGSDKYTDIDKKAIHRYYSHIVDKVSQGKGYYGSDVKIYKEYFPAVMFKTVYVTLHHSGERFCTIREYLSLMGMPEDFILYGNDPANIPLIGQNVPVNTARFMVSQMVNTLADFYNADRPTTANVLFQDNIKQKIYANGK